MLPGMAGAAAGESRWGRRWAAPALAFLATLSLASLAVVTNLATAVVPGSVGWLRDGMILWPAVAVLALISGVLAAWAARSSPASAGLPGVSSSAGTGSVVSGTGPALSGAAYTAQIQDIAPEILLDRDRELAELTSFCAGDIPYA